MTERVTRADLERIAETVTDDLPGPLKVFVQGRNGYYGLDLYDTDGMRDTLHIGTKREIYTYLQGMRRTALLDAEFSRYQETHSV